MDCGHVPATQVDAPRTRSCPSHVAGAQSVPSGMGEQVPSLPAIAHELHFEHAATPQQNPSVQWPLMHSPSTPQTVPFGFRLVHE
jgi:hypothetical protein